MLKGNFRNFAAVMSLLLFMAPRVGGETLHLKSGEKVEGKIVKKTNQYVEVQQLSGLVLPYFLTEIDRIEGETPAATERGLTPSIPPRSESSFAAEKSSTAVFTEASAATVVIYIEKHSGRGGLGNGFIVHPEGIVMTSYHLVQDSKSGAIRLPDGNQYPIESIIDYDIRKDFCVFKVNAQNLPSLKVGDSKQVQVGQRVFTVGNPTGAAYVHADGRVKSLREVGGLVNWIETDLPLPEGTSGSPILNATGEVIGLHTFCTADRTSCFALGINEIKDALRATPKMTFTQFTTTAANAGAEVEQYLIEAAKALSQNEFDQAISAYKKVLEVGADRIPIHTLIDAHRHLGSLYGRRNEHYKTIEHYKRVVQLDPKDAVIAMDLGNAYGRVGDFQKSAEYLQKGLEATSDPSLRFSAYVNLAVTYRYAGEHAKANEVCKEAMRINASQVPADLCKF